MLNKSTVITPCFIYRSRKRGELYLFLAQKDDFTALPETVWRYFGPPEYAMTLQLTPQSRLARSSVAEVLQNLAKRGFHIQLPPEIPLEEQLTAT
ncbi:YcgL domain-containing protein [Ectothiorhodospiraceae bacterium BW-2]|nr:YcgL domain-containing protein [Ectothiorhodospiraceae bacterium BW-2]